jgi:TATA-binding protein-associated factor Taf7
MPSHLFGKGGSFFKPKKKDKDAESYEGKETMAEEMLEHGVALKEPLKSHKGLETPEEEAAEEQEIAELTSKEDDYLEEDSDQKVSLGELRAELKDLLARLEMPTVKRPKMMSLDEKKLPY